jgi:hypothetical protein
VVELALDLVQAAEDRERLLSEVMNAPERRKDETLATTSG